MATPSASPKGFVTVVGPLHVESEARDTAKALDDANHSVYSKALVDAEGCETEEREWFVERNLDATPPQIFGYDWTEIQRMQQKT